MPVSLFLIAVLALGNVVIYGAMSVRERIVVSGAVAAERKSGKAACDIRVSQVGEKHNASVQSGVKDAHAAADGIEQTPAEIDALKELCKRSASCRSRGKL